MQATQPRNLQPRKYRNAIIIGVVLWVMLFVVLGAFFVLGGLRFFIPNYVYLEDVQMVSAGEGWAVGRSYTRFGDVDSNDIRSIMDNTRADAAILHYKAGSWQRYPLTPTNVISDDTNLTAIHMISPNEGWAVGEAVFHYKDGSWQRSERPPYDIMRDVYALPSGEMWVGGVGSIFHLKDDRWLTDTVLYKGQRSRLDGAANIQMLSTNDGWATGEAGLMHYDGSNWQVVDIAIAHETNYFINDLSMISSNEGWFAGWKSRNSKTSDGALTSTNLGTTILHYKDGKFEEQASPYHDEYDRLNNVFMVSPDEGWIVGSDSTADGYDTVILHYKEGKWQEQARFKNIYAINMGLDMISASEGWAVVDRNILHYKDGKWRIFRQ